MNASTALTPIAQVREELAPMRAEFGAVLPSHISGEKFAQVCITAIENNPALLTADRQSFKVACMNAANDGLLPDKREGAFVIFNTEVEVKKEGSNATYKERRALVQWMPMITGILKKAYQTGKIASIAVEIVHKNDVYRRAAGDNAEIVHEPLDFGDRGPVVGGYAIVTMKASEGGGVFREVMSLADIEKVRNVSKTKDRGPWVQFWEEMARKTILRRTLKRVPLSAEVDRVISRDDVFYNIAAENSARLDAPIVATVPTRALFSDRRHRGEPEDDQIDGELDPRDVPDPVKNPLPADAALPNAGDEQAREETRDEEATQDRVPDDDPEVIVALRGVILRAEDISSLDDAEATLRTSPHWLKLTEGARGKFSEMIAQRRAKLGAGPVLRAITTSIQKEPKEYDDPKMWSGDLINKLNAIKDDGQLKSFWAKNVKFVVEGMKIDPAEAGRVVVACGARGLKMPEVTDGE